MSVIQGARPKERVRYTRPSDYLREYIPPDKDLAKKTFKRSPPATPGFGKKLPAPSPSRLPRLPGAPLLFLPVLGEIGDNFYEWYKSPKEGFTPGGWIHCRHCPPGFVQQHPGGTVYGGAIDCTSPFTGCHQSQGYETPIGWFSPPPTEQAMAWTDLWFAGGIFQRHNFVHTFVNPAVGDPSVQPPRYLPEPVLPVTSPWRMRDPNNDRSRLNDPQPYEPPTKAAPAPNKGGWSNDGTPTRPQNRVPRKNEKEKKTRNLGAQLFAGLDFLSEMADIVGAIYDALPADVRKEVEKQWRKDKAFLDKAGQYGVDHADEKLLALWQYWDRLDANQAWKNIAANSLEDQLHGQLHKRLPRNSINAFQGAQKEFGGFVNDFVEVFT